MKCDICLNEIGNKQLALKEMMFGYRDKFSYFSCRQCGCIQITEIPENIEKYYPENYYSFDSVPPKNRSFFRKLQFGQLTQSKTSFLGWLSVAGYHKPTYYEWFANLGVTNLNVSILDIGSGGGTLLKSFYRIGFEDLTGIDPYLKNDIIFNPSLRVLKRSLFQIEKKYDIIMLNHSFEHIPNHHNFFAQLHKSLATGGKVLLRIPIVSDLLMTKYGANLVSLDAPRHLFIHTIKSINLLATQHGFKVTKIVFDSDAFVFIASEQYQKDISMFNDSRSYFVNPKDSIFTPKQIKEFKTEISILNQQHKSDTVAIYMEKST